MLPSCCAHQLSQITLAPAENEPPDLLFQICVCMFMFYMCPFLSMPVSQSPSCLSFQVGPQSTLVRTQCLCNHLTYFGSDFFLVPRTVNVEDVAELFLRVTSNPVGVSLLASLVGIYITHTHKKIEGSGSARDVSLAFFPLLRSLDSRLVF